MGTTLLPRLKQFYREGIKVDPLAALRIGKVSGTVRYLYRKASSSSLFTLD